MSNWFSPYNVTKSSSSYFFETSCKLIYELGFKEDPDFFGYETSEFKFLTLYFNKDKFDNPKEHYRVASTLCNTINNTLSTHSDKVIWYICSNKSFIEGQPDDPKYGEMRQRIFRQWFYKHKEIFPDIKFFTKGTKKKSDTPNTVDPIHAGFLYHCNFKSLEELKSLIDLISGDEAISSDKDSYMEAH